MEWYKKGRKLAVTKEYQEALKTFDKAIALNPEYADAWYEEARVSCDRALEITPNYAWAMGYRALDNAWGVNWNWYRKGVAKERLGAYEEAIADYSRALQLKPNYQKAKDGIEWLFLRK